MRFSSNGTVVQLVQLYLATAIFGTQAEFARKPDQGTPGIVSGSNIHADAGILSSPPLSANERAFAYDIATSAHIVSPNAERSSIRRVQTTFADLCPQGYVDCVNGLVRGSSSSTCASACGVSCCLGTNACNSFTGKICKDGSCDGERACTFANVPWVVNSCRGGATSCYRAGKQGTVGIFVNACNGTRNCYDLGYKGIVGNIQDSCFGLESCSRLGQDGIVGNVYNSCNGGEFACFKVGEYYGAVGDIQDSCHGFQSCFLLGKLLTVGNVRNSCNQPTSCLFLARLKGTVGSIRDSCNGVDACNRGASYGGSLKNLALSCNAGHACMNAGRGLANPLHITSDINNYCNTVSACAWANQATLPGDCQTGGTTAPSKAPTDMPTSSSPSIVSTSHAPTSTRPSSSPSQFCHCPQQTCIPNTSVPTEQIVTASPTSPPSTTQYMIANPTSSPTEQIVTASPTSPPSTTQSMTANPTSSAKPTKIKTRFSPTIKSSTKTKPPHRHNH